LEVLSLIGGQAALVLVVFRRVYHKPTDDQFLSSTTEVLFRLGELSFWNNKSYEFK
jgi:hypothetical protein